MDALKNELFILLFLWMSTPYILAQEQNTYHIKTIAFYNLENLFDTENDSLTFDDDRTPNGKDNWTKERYQKKVENMSYVLSQIGTDITKTSPAIIGLCEIENKSVLEDLVNHHNLSSKAYGIIHRDSPDERGIDVAFLYKKSSFIVDTYQSHRLVLNTTEGYNDYTRDQLVVKGYLDNEPLYFIINHWPSRSGGKARSQPHRIAAAQLNERIIDSIQKENSEAKIISMGDFNDDPTDDSIKKILKVKGKQDPLKSPYLFNPFERLYKKGIGSLAYRDQWNLFDQLFFTNNLLPNQMEYYSFWKANVFNPPYLIDSSGRFKGYPLRTYAGGNYIGGYSDHFPVYLYLIKKVKL